MDHETQVQVVVRDALGPRCSWQHYDPPPVGLNRRPTDSTDIERPDDLSTTKAGSNSSDSLKA